MFLDQRNLRSFLDSTVPAGTRYVPEPPPKPWEMLRSLGLALAVMGYMVGVIVVLVTILGH